MNLLTSVDNFNVIKSVLQTTFKKKQIDIKDQHDNDIRQVIQFIDSKIQYIDSSNIQSINKKVLDFSLNAINDSRSKTMTRNKPPPPKNRASVESIFDETISNESNPSNFMPPPSITQGNSKSMDDILQSHESDRKLLDPPRPINTHKDINFSLEEPEVDQKEAYEEMLKNRGLTSDTQTPDTQVDDNEFNINDIPMQDIPVQDIPSQDIPTQDIEPTKIINNFSINGLTDNMSTSIHAINSNISRNDNIGNDAIRTDNRLDDILNSRQTNIFTPTPNIISKTHYLTIDSRYRNFELYPNPSNFQIIFKNENIYSNVKSISLVHCSIPNVNITPYLKLYIDELPSNFVSIGSSDKYFTKLIRREPVNTDIFCDVISIADEIILEETRAGIIDKMTCNIQTSLDMPLLQDIDKIHIKHLEKVNGNIKLYLEDGQTKTSMANEDIVYIYNTTPTVDDRISFDKDIVISTMDIIDYTNEHKESLVKINANYYSSTQSNNMEIDAQSMLKNDKMEMEERGYNFANILNPESDYLYIRYKNTETGEVYEEIMKIYNVIQEDLIIVKPLNYNNDIGYEIQEFKYVRRKAEGYNVTDHKSLYYKGGHKVYDVGVDSFCIRDVVIGEMNEPFYIHHNNQINYTFRIVT